ncbi:hypothetical protein BASA81_002614 [Batrachochytrium salamandrivorans]|nr:hypothetical protein BASA81_002614 [Batrachochytrium salamandrivorans]
MAAFVFSPSEVDFHLFGLWLAGLSVQQASQKREDEDSQALFELGLLDYDTADHYRMFEQLEPVLEEPEASCCLLELPQSVHAELSKRFYQFDSTVMREFLNRKFTARARKDWLEEVSETTGVPLRSCLRQYDNIRRLFDAADETGFQRPPASPVGMAEAIGAEFHLPPALMRSYEQILFLMCHRFNIKRNNRQSSIPLEVYLECAHRMMTKGWCLGAGGGESFTFEFDPALLARFRDFKNRVPAVDIWEDVEFEGQNKRKFENKFKPWFRALVQFGTGRDLRDFFEDLSEAVSELRELEPDLKQMFQVEDNRYLPKLLEVMNLSLSAALSPQDYATWQTYINVVWPCLCLLEAVLE